MIKRILVGLDPSADTAVATRYAISLARNFNAHLTGLAIIDMKNIESEVSAGGIGTIYYAKQMRESLEKRTRERAVALISTFYETVQQAGVSCIGELEKGVPYERIAEEMKYHDLLVLGRDSHFYYNRPQRETKTLENVIKKSIAPTLIVTGEYREIDRVIIAYDESAASARALQNFVYLKPYGNKTEVELVHVVDTNTAKAEDRADLLLQLAEGYLKDHGFDSVKRTVLDKGNPAKKILNRLKETNADLIVLGAHSMSAIRRATFGSITYDLVQKSPVPLFVNN